jgi:hypothetical protein
MLLLCVVLLALQLFDNYGKDDPKKIEKVGHLYKDHYHILRFCYSGSVVTLYD